MLSAFDDYPVHQTALPLAHAGDGHPDFYDRFFFNGYTEDLYFGLALGTYPNRGVIDAAFSVVHGGVQRSVFASGPMPLERTRTAVGPLTVEILEPMRAARIVVDAPEHGLAADLTFRARTAVCEEARQTRYQGARLAIDITRATQLGGWSGTLESGGARVEPTGPVYGTKDRSWGVRPVGDPAPAAPSTAKPQFFFLWAPLNFADECLHYLVLEDGEGRPWSRTAVSLPVIGATDPVLGEGAVTTPLASVTHRVSWAPGLRRSDGASLRVRPTEGAPDGQVRLEPLSTFRMSGLGYSHPRYAHGRWHGGEVVDGEAFAVGELDNTEPRNVHVQQVMRLDWNGRPGLGVLEQLVVGPHTPSGFTGLFDGLSGAGQE